MLRWMSPGGLRLNSRRVKTKLIKGSVVELRIPGTLTFSAQTYFLTSQINSAVPHLFSMINFNGALRKFDG